MNRNLSLNLNLEAEVDPEPGTKEGGLGPGEGQGPDGDQEVGLRGGQKDLGVDQEKNQEIENDPDRGQSLKRMRLN